MSRKIVDLRDVSFLVVDDNDFMRNIISVILKSLGAQASNIREAMDGADALDVLTTYKPDIAIVDYMMWPSHGVEFVAALRRDPKHPCRMMPVIMLTAYSENKIVDLARKNGVTEFVTKPVSVRSLYLRIEEVILHPRPFVEAFPYSGPDRRRHSDQGYQGPRRRGEDRLSSAAACA